MTIMFAFGSNLSLRQMRIRCPDADPVCKMYLDDAKLLFRGVADCPYKPGAQCPGGVWRVTPRCIEALDRYEGFRADGSGMYRKEYAPIEGIEGETEIMYYVMNSTGIYPPSQRYLDTIIEGYKDFGLDLEPLRKAVRESYDQKNPTHIERQRLAKAGHPRLALSKTVR